MRSTSLVRAVTMMIGRWRVAGRPRRMRHTSKPESTGRFRSSTTTSGGRSAIDGERGVAGADQLDRGLAVALERVGDQPADVGLVLDDEDAGRPRQSGGGRRRGRDVERCRGSRCRARLAWPSCR